MKRHYLFLTLSLILTSLFFLVFYLPRPPKSKDVTTLMDHLSKLDSLAISGNSSHVKVMALQGKKVNDGTLIPILMFMSEKGFFKYLTTLKFNNTDITETSFNLFNNLESLHELSLDNIQISSKSLGKILQISPGLRIVHMKNISLSPSDIIPLLNTIPNGCDFQMTIDEKFFLEVQNNHIVNITINDSDFSIMEFLDAVLKNDQKFPDIIYINDSLITQKNDIEAIKKQYPDLIIQKNSAL